MKRELAHWIDSYLLFQENTEPPTIYHEWVAVSLIAAALQRKCFLTWEKRIYPNQYIALVGPAGRCRKGTAMAPAKKILSDIGLEIAPDSTSREALIIAMQGNVATYTDERGLPQLHSSLTAFADELVVLLGNNRPEFISFLTDIYDCKDIWRNNTKNKGNDEIMGAYFNLIGGITPELVRTHITQEVIGGGLTSRIIFVYSGSIKQRVILPIPTQKERDLEIQLKNELIKIKLISGEFVFHEQVIMAYGEFYKAQDEEWKHETQEVMLKYVERRPTHLRKLCMIFSAARSSERIIRIEDFRRALDLLKRTEKTMPNTFGGIGQSKSADITHRVMTYIGANKSVKFSALLQIFHLDANKQELANVIATLEAMKFCSLTYSDNDVNITLSARSERRPTSPAET